MYIDPEWTVCKAEGQGKTFGSEDGVTEDCVFPFKYGGKLHGGCVPSSNGKGPWCATKVDSKGIMKTWARCNGICKTDKGISLLSSLYL